MRVLVLGLGLLLGLVGCRDTGDLPGVPLTGSAAPATSASDLAAGLDPARAPACGEAFSMPELRLCLDSVQVDLEAQMAGLLAMRLDSLQAYIDRGPQVTTNKSDTLGWRASLVQGQEAFDRYRRTQCGGDAPLVEGQWLDYAGWVSYETGAVNGSQTEIPECHIILLRRRVAELEDPHRLRLPDGS